MAIGIVLKIEVQYCLYLLYRQIIFIRKNILEKEHIVYLNGFCLSDIFAKLTPHHFEAENLQLNHRTYLKYRTYVYVSAVRRICFNSAIASALPH